MAGLQGISRFERFFPSAASLDVDKSDLKAYSDFLNTKIADLMIRAQAVAKENGRDIILLSDLPITKGLQESIHQFKKMDERFEIEPLLEHLAALPQLHLDYSLEVREALGALAGGLSVALARTLRVIDPDLRHPHQEHWERCFRIFSMLL